ncbi:hypothetical protein Bhyg_10470 [Pseudolycoriella hygida]|uniref:Uncharacterized protein n=1 Tax=Pseudolycoriella hygida TaxID=35572 RepID=A0A9Q0MU02_9DIPT|nr:hypothetical protein Bhyg_10470 [Pseudolycoriella hygida]
MSSAINPLRISSSGSSTYSCQLMCQYDVILIKLSTQNNEKKLNKRLDIIVYAVRYRDLEPNIDQEALQDFLAILIEINGEPFTNAQIIAEKNDLRRLIANTMQVLIATVEAELPNMSARLLAFNWRNLFGIGPQPAIYVTITQATDDELSIGSMSTES